MNLVSRIFLLCLFNSLSLYAADLSDLTYTTTNGEVTITDCDGGATGELFIPDTIQGNPVTSIGDDAFSRCWGLTNITISNGVTSIGTSAFWSCIGLTSIAIPESVTSFGEGAFSGCSSLTSITIPGSITSIADYGFYNCSSLTSITIPDSVARIGDPPSVAARH